MRKYDVFISYSRKDYVDEKRNVIPDNVVSKIKDALSSAEITYWFDEDGIDHGDDFADKIVANIEASEIFVFLSTINSNSSPWTRKEIACAHEMDKKIIPVRIDASKYDRSVMLRIADLDYLDYAKNPEKGAKDLVKTIRHYLEEKQRKEKIKENEDERIRRNVLKQKEIDEIELLIKKIEVEELGIEVNRNDLIIRIQRLDDDIQKKRLLELIDNCGSIHLKIKDRDKRILELENNLKEHKVLNSNLFVKKIAIVCILVVGLFVLRYTILSIMKKTDFKKDYIEYSRLVAEAEILFDSMEYEQSRTTYLKANDYVDKYKDTKYSEKFIKLDIDKLDELQIREEEKRRVIARENRSKELRDKEVGSINGHNWVDLGLPSKLKWATCNIGASSPCDYGSYYAWKDTETKTNYSSNLYNHDYSYTIQNIAGNDTFDVARVKWGGSWRLPSKHEFEDMLNMCICRDTMLSGTKGLIVTGPNGNQIFLPAAGYREGSVPMHKGERGYYWSSLSSNWPYCLEFDSGSQYVNYGTSFHGYSVRPITE